MNIANKNTKNHINNSVTFKDQAYYYSGYIICGTNMWPYFFAEGFEVICICKGDSLITTSSPSL